MRILSVCLLVLFVSIAHAAVTLDDVVKLSKAKTNDDVILQLIQKEGLAKPVTSKDIVYLKQQGVSDRVLQYLMKLSEDNQPVYVDKNLRTYYSTTKDGKKIQVVTNLDEKGKRMGGPIPPDPEPVQAAPVYERPPQEIRIVVENDSRRDDRYEDEYPEYVDDRYMMPEYPSYYAYSTPYYPYYPYYPKQHHRRGGHHRSGDPNQPNWNFDYGRKPLVRQRHQQSTPNKAPGTGAKPVKPFRSFKG